MLASPSMAKQKLMPVFHGVFRPGLIHSCVGLLRWLDLGYAILELKVCEYGLNCDNWISPLICLGLFWVQVMGSPILGKDSIPSYEPAVVVGHANPFL